LALQKTSKRKAYSVIYGGRPVRYTGVQHQSAPGRQSFDYLAGPTGLPFRVAPFTRLVTTRPPRAVRRSFVLAQPKRLRSSAHSKEPAMTFILVVVAICVVALVFTPSRSRAPSRRHEIEEGQGHARISDSEPSGFSEPDSGELMKQATLAVHQPPTPATIQPSPPPQPQRTKKRGGGKHRR
jgi:hypothetical protein